MTDVRKVKKMVHEGRYLAELEVELISDTGGWSPYIKLDDAIKLDEVREALKEGDIKRAKELATIYTLSPVAA